MSNDIGQKPKPQEVLTDSVVRLSQCFLSMGSLATLAESQPEGLNDQQLDEEFLLEEQVEGILNEVPERLPLVREAARVTIETILFDDTRTGISTDERNAMRIASAFASAYVDAENKKNA